MSETPLLVLERVEKRYHPDAPPAVSDLSLAIAGEEIFVLLGPSGCGKTTTLRLIAGFETADAGRILVRGRAVDDGPVRVAPERRRIGFVFQDHALFPHLTVWGNLAFGLRGLPAAPKRRRVEEILALCELEGLAERYPHELSGGQQQRVALGRAIAPETELVLLDEPLSNLDPSLRAALRQELRRVLQRAGKAAILVTHDQEEAFEIADRIGVMREGRLEQVGAPAAVYALPATPFVARFVCEANLLPGRPAAEGVETELGLLPLASAPPPGAPVEVMIRSTDVELEPDPGGPAVIAERFFRGAHSVYVVRLPSGVLLRCRAAHASPMSIGLRVSVRLRADAGIVFGGEGPARPSAPFETEARSRP